MSSSLFGVRRVRFKYCPRHLAMVKYPKEVYQGHSFTMDDCQSLILKPHCDFNLNIPSLFKQLTSMFVSNKPFAKLFLKYYQITTFKTNSRCINLFRVTDVISHLRFCSSSSIAQKFKIQKFYTFSSILSHLMVWVKNKTLYVKI